MDKLTEHVASIGIKAIDNPIGSNLMILGVQK
jgi:hypothetical protein